MVVIDAQIHSWYSDRPSRPWHPDFRLAHRDRPTYLQHVGQTNSPEMVRSEMAGIGVDGAVLIPVGVYGSSIELELEAATACPDSFKVIGLIDHLADDLGSHLERAKARGLVGVRMLEMREPDRVARGEFDNALRLCVELRLVVALSLRHPVDSRLVELMRRHNDVFFFIDHLGTGFAPPVLGYRPEKPFEHLAAVVELAQLRNVALKLTGAPSLSLETYPFRDVWSPIAQLVAAFGAERVFWGSDYTRTAALHSYWEAKHYLAEIPDFSQGQLKLMYGDALAARIGWTVPG